MKIAQIAPLWESVPPVLYGGTERVVSCITEELVRQGHEVTLFASGDSTTKARLIPMCPEALRPSKVAVNYDAPVTAMLEKVFGAAEQFDIIHSHLEFIPFPLARRSLTPMLTTLHARLDLPELVPVFRKFADLPRVALSDIQRESLPWANWQATIPPGLPEQLYARGGSRRDEGAARVDTQRVARSNASRQRGPRWRGRERRPGAAACGPADRTHSRSRRRNAGLWRARGRPR